MIRTIINGIINNDVIIIFTILLFIIRVAYIINDNKKIVLYRELLLLLFLLYLNALFYIVTFQDVNYGFSNFIPFKEMFRYPFLSDKFIRNTGGNILLFAPYGYFVAYFFKYKRLLPIFLLTLLSSISIETMQYFNGRVFDIDDIILNIIGGIIGYFIYIGVNAIVHRFPKFLKKDIVLNIIALIIILIIVFYIRGIL